MPQLDFDGANSKISADKIQGQSGTTVTIPAGHNLAGDGSGLTSLPAANLTGTIADARLPDPLPAIDGSALTNLPAAGGFKFLAHSDVSNVASIDFDSSDGISNSTYAGYFFNITRMFPASNNRVRMRVSDNDGSTWKTSSYKNHLASIDEDALVQSACSNSGPADAIYLCVLTNGNSAGFMSNVQVYIPSIAQSTEYIFANIQGSFREDSSSYDTYSCYGGGAWSGNSDSGGVDAFQFSAESGNITAKITMFGIIKA